MAQTKQKQGSGGSRTGSKSHRSGGAQSAKRAPGGRSNGSRSNGSRSNASRSNGSRPTAYKRRSSSKSTGVRGRVAEAVTTVKGTGQDAANRFAQGAERAKTPLIAGGAAVVGLAGGAVLARGKAGRKLVQLPIPPLARRSSTAKALGFAAKEVGKAGYQVGQLTSEVQKIRQAIKNS